MITGWLVKLVLVLGLLGFAFVEAGSPWIVKAQLDGVAHDAADEASQSLLHEGTPDSARFQAEAVAEDHNAKVSKFSIDDRGRVHLTVEREARSFLVHKIKRFRGYYDVKVSVVSDKRGN